MVGGLADRVGDEGLRRLVVAVAAAPPSGTSAVLRDRAGVTEQQLFAEASG
jgi:hypothetical protein